MSTVQFFSTARDGLPPWVLSFVGRTVQERVFRTGPHEVTAVDGEHGVVATVHVRDALEMSADDLAAATTSAYGSIRSLITARPELRTLRLWNLIPGILDPVDGLPHRYMAFNAGRFAAIREWSATDGDVTGWMPTASGVGSTTPDLVIHALAGACTPVPVENPRQISSYRYSRRYGPSPPCFSRAVRVPARGSDDALLLLGGTASVVGEATCHAGDLSGQIDETMDNLGALIVAGLPGPRSSTADAVASIRDAVVYYVREDDRDAIEWHVRARLTGADAIEFARRSLCRDDLLIEIEGIATPFIF